MTVYHFCTNGIVGHFHCQLKTTLPEQSNKTNWVENLLIVLFSLRNIKEDSAKLFLE